MPGEPVSAPVLVIGRSGQIAQALAGLGHIAGRPVVAAGRPEVDLGAPDTLAAALARHNPAFVVNAGAFTAVDEAESRQAEAFAANAQGPGALARACAAADIPLLHISTDYVFDGTGRRPYREDDPVAPASVYGASKANGESEVRAAGGRHLIVRTAWVYSHTGRNFVKTMLRLGAERPELAVVDDQQGSPTYAVDAAEAMAGMIAAVLAEPHGDLWGTYHVTNAGTTTWYGFAAAIFERAEARGWRVPKLRPITTAEYPTPAKRPAYSVLDTGKLRRVFGIAPPPWQDALERCLARIEPAERA